MSYFFYKGLGFADNIASVADPFFPSQIMGHKK